MIRQWLQRLTPSSVKPNKENTANGITKSHHEVEPSTTASELVHEALEHLREGFRVLNGQELDGGPLAAGPKAELIGELTHVLYSVNEIINELIEVSDITPRPTKPGSLHQRPESRMPTLAEHMEEVRAMTESVEPQVELHR